MSENNHPLTMCWFGTYQPYATSVVHVPEQEISPKEIDTDDLIFIWDKYMKFPNLLDLLGEPIPWSPALIDGYARDWVKKDERIHVPILVNKPGARCLGAVLLTSRLSMDQLEPLVDDYRNRGYELKKIQALVGDLSREVLAFLPQT